MHTQKAKALNYLLDASHPVVVGSCSRQRVGGLGAAHEDGAGSQNGERSRGDPTLRVKAVYRQGDLYKKGKDKFGPISKIGRLKSPDQTFHNFRNTKNEKVQKFWVS